MNIRVLLIFILLIKHYVILGQQKDTLPIYKTEEEYFQSIMTKYVKKSPLERNSFIYKYFTNPPSFMQKETSQHFNKVDSFISYKIAGWLINDIQSLSGKKFKSKLFDITEPSIVIFEEKELSQSLDSLNNLLSNTRFINDISNFIKIDYKKKVKYSYKKPSYEFIFRYYFQNSILNRIRFIKEYYKIIEPEILIIIKTDLDTLLKVKTNKITKRNGKIRRKFLFSAIKTWENTPPIP